MVVFVKRKCNIRIKFEFRCSISIVFRIVLWTDVCLKFCFIDNADFWTDPFDLLFSNAFYTLPGLVQGGDKFSQMCFITTEPDKINRQVTGIPMSTNYALLTPDLLLWNAVYDMDFLRTDLSKSYIIVVLNNPRVYKYVNYIISRTLNENKAHQNKTLPFLALNFCFTSQKLKKIQQKGGVFSSLHWQSHPFGSFTCFVYYINFFVLPMLYIVYSVFQIFN